MFPQTTLQTLLLEITERVFDTPFLFINPRHPHRPALIAYLLQEFDAPVYYYALTANDYSVREFVHNFAASAQFPDSFRNPILKALEETDDAKAWAEVIGAQLGKLEKSAYMLILDNLDYIQYSGPAYADFFLTLADYMPKQAQIAVNGRELGRHPWSTLAEAGKGSAVGTGYGIDGQNMFDVPVNMGSIEFFSLTGDIRVISDGFQVTTWDGALPRNLCYYFIEKERVTRSEIFETFWPHLPIKEATNVFHVTKRKISEKLGYDITTYGGGFYGPSNEVQIIYDARILEQTYEETMRMPDAVTPNRWFRIIQLHQAPYLQGLDMPWVENKREKLNGYYIHALLELGRYYEAHDRLEDALGFYLRAAAIKPDREDVHRYIMTIYHRQGRIGEIKKQYQILERELKRTLNIKPSQRTLALYNELLEG